MCHAPTYIKYCISVEGYNTETPRIMGKRKENTIYIYIYILYS